MKALVAAARTLFLIAALGAVTVPARAQNIITDSVETAAAPRPSDVKQRTDSTPPWLTRRELTGFGVSLLATIAVAPLDKPSSEEFQEPRWKDNRLLQNVTTDLAFAGGPGPFFVGAGLFAAGEIGRAPGLASAGEHVTEAVVLAASLTGLGKGIFGRALPGVQTDEKFELARGFHRGNGPFVSFPSGHTAAAFALASSLTGEAEAWRPGLATYVGPVSYSVASAIGLARVYQHVHWTSDLPLAAAIGTWSGLSVESHVHQNNHASAFTHALTAASLQYTPDGRAVLGFSMRFGAAE